MLKEFSVTLTSIKTDLKMLQHFLFCIFSYQTSLDLVAAEKIDVKPLITHQYKLEDTLDAFETSRTGRGNAIKVLIYPKKDWVPTNK